MAVLERNLIFFFKYIKYGMNAIAAVIDMVLLNQNSEQESINVIFPSGFLYVYPHLGACMIIIQTLQNQKTHSCPSTSVVWLYWSAFHANVFCFVFVLT